MGSQPRGVGQTQELIRQADQSDLKGMVPEWARGTNGVLLEGVTLTHAPQAIGHGLNRIPKGWFVVGSYSHLNPVEHGRTSTALVLSAPGEKAFWSYTGSLGAATDIDEIPIWEAHWPSELIKAEIVTSTAVASDGTDYRNFVIARRASTDYTTAIPLATRTTESTGITAWTPWEITITNTTSTRFFARDDILTFKALANAGGKALVDIIVEFDIDHTGPRTVDLWVY